MNQVLHIFRKDLRHFWKEIAISWCVLVIYVWQAEEQWNPENMFGPRYFSQLTEQLLPLLLILSWCVLLIRAIQDRDIPLLFRLLPLPTAAVPVPNISPSVPAFAVCVCTM